MKFCNLRKILNCSECSVFNAYSVRMHGVFTAQRNEQNQWKIHMYIEMENGNEKIEQGRIEK